MSPAVITILVAFVLAWVGLLIWGKKWINIPQWARILSMAIIVAGMGYVVWWMQDDAKKKEIAFMGVCWIDGTAYLPEGGVGDSEACSVPEPIKWHSKELSVYWD